MFSKTSSFVAAAFLAMSLINAVSAAPVPGVADSVIPAGAGPALYKAGSEAGSAGYVVPGGLDGVEEARGKKGPSPPTGNSMGEMAYGAGKAFGGTAAGILPASLVDGAVDQIKASRRD